VEERQLPCNRPHKRTLIVTFIVIIGDQQEVCVCVCERHQPPSILAVCLTLYPLPISSYVHPLSPSYSFPCVSPVSFSSLPFFVCCVCRRYVYFLADLHGCRVRKKVPNLAFCHYHCSFILFLFWVLFVCSGAFTWSFFFFRNCVRAQSLLIYPKPFFFFRYGSFC
jgi:hypothetical protein